MAYVIAEPCIGTKDTACVDVCPVDCIHPRKDEPNFEGETQLYIHPTECIDAALACRSAPLRPSLRSKICQRSGKASRPSMPIGTQSRGSSLISCCAAASICANSALRSHQSVHHANSFVLQIIYFLDAAVRGFCVKFASGSLALAFSLACIAQIPLLSRRLRPLTNRKPSVAPLPSKETGPARFRPEKQSFISYCMFRKRRTALSQQQSTASIKAFTASK